MPSTTSKIMAQYECGEGQVPARLFRVRYSGNQSLKARAKPSFKSPSDFKVMVESHLKWCSCEPTPFVSLFASKDHAITWARQLLGHGYRDVVLLEIDAGRLSPLFCVRDLVQHRGVRTTLAGYLYEDEYLGEPDYESRENSDGEWARGPHTDFSGTELGIQIL
ncbi:hypothetical protein PF008_g7497 [Phytophthora fragariae]|uniref:DUF7587 domain-containing protein n=1 Tax=Phytophthora fragariae TaxID=53985 RepID=A0A6G0S2X3_9STRA|nr:hypothetical protein PF008_g7497 [Phytophthora fragariae]